MSVFGRLFERRIVPVVVLERSTDASALANALVGGGLPVAEVTFRTEAAADSIKTMADRGDMIVGAGTVLTKEQVDRAIDAGAQYIVSPGTSSPVIEHCLDKNIPVLPGAVTATEIMTLLGYDLNVVKFFPAGTSGGPNAIKALSAPFGGTQFVPTGGVSADNLGDYLSIPAVPAVGGSWMVSPTLIAAGDFDAIQDLTLKATRLAAGVQK